MVVALARDRGACGHDVSAADEQLPDGAGVVPLRLERFDVRRAGGREHSPVERAAVAVLVRDAGRGEERAARCRRPRTPAAGPRRAQ